MVLLKPSRGEWEGFGKVERSRGRHSGKGNGTHEGLDRGQYKMCLGNDR